MQLVNKKLDYKDAWEEVNDIYLFTGNSYITKNNKLVMGRGAALEVRDQYINIDSWFGTYIKHLSKYGVLINSDMELGVFQVKRNFRDSASLELIDYSAEMLSILAHSMPDKIFRMNYPGIGNGGLEFKYVNPLLEHLPDNVLIYKMD